MVFSVCAGNIDHTLVNHRSLYVIYDITSMIIFDNKCQEILQEMGSSVAVISIYIHHIMVQTRGYSKHSNTSRTDLE